MLTCQQLTELVTDYLEGRLSFMDRVRFHMHIGMCGRCRAYLRQMRMTIRTLGKLPAEPVPAEMRDELLARFRGMQPRGGGPRPDSAHWPARLLGAIEKALGGHRGWTIVGLVLAASVVMLLVSGATLGPLLIHGRTCPLTDLAIVIGAGVVPLAFAISLVRHARARLSPGAYAAAASLGSLVGYVALQATCAMAHVAPHVLVFHVGGILLAVAMGTAASRLPALR